MVFRKYRAVKQWGKMDTRIFKEIYNSRNKRKMPSFTIPESIANLNVKVYEPTDPLLFARQTAKKEPVQPIVAPSLNIEAQSPKDEDHPLYNSTKAFVFEADEPLSDGIAQASLLTRSVVRNGLPESILHNSTSVEFDEHTIKDAILHGERFDPTLEKLPRRFDPVLFWIKHPRVYGTPVIKKNNIILNNLLRQVIFTGLRTELLKNNVQLNRDAPLSVLLSGGKYFSNNPFVLRAQPHLTVQSIDEQVNWPWAGTLDVKEASNESLPDIHPISPIIDLNREHIYNRDVLLTRAQLQTHVHSILWSREQDQKYPWTREQNAANAIMTTYAAAVAEAKRNGKEKLEKPVLVRGVQLVDGRLDLVAFQLNTLKLTENGENEEKNIVWIEKGARLYKAKPFYESFHEVEKLDMEVFKKFVALMLGFGSPHAH